MKLYGFEKVRIYGKEAVLAYDEKGYESYVVYTYKDYDILGNLVGEGEEDFSIRRLGHDTTHAFVRTWKEGNYNRGGYKKWERSPVYRIRNTEADKAVFKLVQKLRVCADEVKLECF